MRKFIFKSSAHLYGCEQDDPAFFTESMSRTRRPVSAIERDVVEAEASVADFAVKQPEVDVTVLRCANVLGPDVRTSFSRMFSLPLVPMVLGFDPRCQFVHEDDVVHALEHAAITRSPGVFNVAGDGVLALSEVIGLLGKRPAPVLPPWGTSMLAGPLRSLGLRIPDEMLNQMRFGPRPGQPPLQGDGVRVRLHHARKRARLRRAPAIASDPAGSRAGLHV